MSKIPEYYKRGGIVCWDPIEAWTLGYNLGNVIKYTMRAGYKTPDPRKDLRKAIHSLEREIECYEARGKVKKKKSTKRVKK